MPIRLLRLIVTAAVVGCGDAALEVVPPDTAGTSEISGSNSLGHDAADGVGVQPVAGADAVSQAEVDVDDPGLDATGVDSVGAEPTDSSVPSQDVAVVCAAYGPGCEDVPHAPPGTTGTLFPIVLVHGMGGFDSLGPIPYFVGVEDDLTEHGYLVTHTVVDPFNGSDTRAAQLVPQIDHILACTCAPKVNLIAHSQGGIDARVLVDELGYGDRVAAVVTVATPHEGSPIASALLALDPTSADPIINVLGGFVAGLYTNPLEQTDVRKSLSWCDHDFLAAHFAGVARDKRVSWFSYAGRAGLLASGSPDCDGAPLPNPPSHTPVSASMTAGFTVLGGAFGPANDGLVTVAGAKYGEFQGCVAADHMQEIGLSLVAAVAIYDHRALYRTAAALLVSRGF